MSIKQGGKCLKKEKKTESEDGIAFINLFRGCSDAWDFVGSDGNFYLFRFFFPMLCSASFFFTLVLVHLPIQTDKKVDSLGKKNNSLRLNYFFPTSHSSPSSLHLYHCTSPKKLHQ